MTTTSWYDWWWWNKHKTQTKSKKQNKQTKKQKTKSKTKTNTYKNGPNPIEHGKLMTHYDLNFIYLTALLDLYQQLPFLSVGLIDW